MKRLSIILFFLILLIGLFGCTSKSNQKTIVNSPNKDNEAITTSNKKNDIQEFVLSLVPIGTQKIDMPHT